MSEMEQEYDRKWTEMENIKAKFPKYPEIKGDPSDSLAKKITIVDVYLEALKAHEAAAAEAAEAAAAAAAAAEAAKAAAEAPPPRVLLKPVTVWTIFKMFLDETKIGLNLKFYITVFISVSCAIVKGPDSITNSGKL